MATRPSTPLFDIFLLSVPPRSRTRLAVYIAAGKRPTPELPCSGQRPVPGCSSPGRVSASCITRTPSSSASGPTSGPEVEAAAPRPPHAYPRARGNAKLANGPERLVANLHAGFCLRQGNATSSSPSRDCQHGACPRPRHAFSVETSRDRSRDSSPASTSPATETTAEGPPELRSGSYCALPIVAN
ncbi:hypothetical protein CDD83_4275 [Cordyceps sp. RAO-2017]|nr:hypothetical protein CDD83_4275 [Cordyceps sp. RAO-2017]